MGKRDMLRVISRTPGVSLYELVSDLNDGDDSKSSNSLDPRIKRYIASTSQTQQITTQAETVSPEFENLLQQGIGATISRSGLADIIRQTIGQNTGFVDVLFILRGGLNFDPTTGLGEIGLRKIEHYLSSQRKRIADSDNPECDKWEIVHDGYKKMFEAETEPRQINLFLGDIVATGTSLQHGLVEFLSEMKQKGYTLNSLNFFSIGVKRTEEIISELFGKEEFNNVFAANFKANVIYLEGRFGLAKKTSPLRIKNPDTDLLVYHEGAITTPEFVRELLTRSEYLLEPCIIYDGGKRRSAHRAHLKEVIEYWETLKRYANKGLRLHTAINERYPVVRVSNVEQWRVLHPSWKEIESSVIDDLIREKNFLIAGAPNTTKALRELCERRLRTVRAMLEPEGLRTSEESETSQGLKLLQGLEFSHGLGKLEPSASSHTREHTREKPTHHIGMTSEFIQHDEPTTILISGEPDRTNRIYRMLDMMERHVKTGRGLPIGKGYLIRMIDGKEYKLPVAVATSGMGFGSTEITTIEMIETYASAVKALKEQVEKSASANPGKPINLIRVGTCGSHQPKVYGGDLVIATKTYCPFGSVSDLIETSHDSALHHFKIGYLRVLEEMFDALLTINDFSLAEEIISLLRQKMPKYEQAFGFIEQSKQYIKQYTKKVLTNLEEAVSYKLAECEVAQSYTCDLDIIRHLQRTSRQLNFDEDKIHTGPVFSKTTLFSEAYHAFSIEPEEIRKRRLDYRSKIMKQLPVYCSEMEIAMMSAVAHLARLKGYDVRVGGIMAVVNNPRDPSRSENPLFADTMTISMAVDRAILLGLEGAVEVYKQQCLKR